MGEVADAGIPRPFHERFNIPLEDKEAHRRFINRIRTVLLDNVNEALEVADVDLDKFKRDVAYALGEKRISTLHTYIDNDFHRCLRVLEIMYQVVREADIRELWSVAIRKVIDDSEVGLGISWQPPIFVRTGAALLDERLVNEPLLWLSNPRYQTVLEPFRRGLSHYLEDRLADAVTDMYEAVEALARII